MLVRMTSLVLLDTKSMSYVFVREGVHAERSARDTAQGGPAAGTGLAHVEAQWTGARADGAFHFDIYGLVEANLAAGFIESEASFIKSLQFLFEVVDVVADDHFLRCASLSFTHCPSTQH